jgi:ABC-type sugar transport system substrate-binding protein
MKIIKILVGCVLSFGLSTASAELIGISIQDASSSFQLLLRDNLEQTIEFRGADSYSDVGSEEKLQIAQIQSFVDAELDAIIVIPVSTDKAYIQKLIDIASVKKTPLVFMNRQPNMDTFPPGVVFVGSRESQAGTLQMEEVARQSNYKGRVALLMGPSSHPAAIDRTKMVDDITARYPDMKITLREYANWQRNESLGIVTRWLKDHKDEFDIIVANNDEMALGAVLAMEEAGVDPKPYIIAGIDATADALNAISTDKMDVSVLQDASGLARKAVVTAFSLIRGQGSEPYVWVPFRLVNTENLEQFLK